MLHEFLETAISRQLSNKAACLVIQNKKSITLHCGDSRPDTLYDLASLTKIICTTLLTAQAICEASLSLHECPWPGWPGVSVGNVLNHTAGLPPWRPLHSLAEVYDIKPLHPPSGKTLYSDVGFIALGALLRERRGRGLEDFAHLLGTKELQFGGPEGVEDPRCHALGGVTGHAGVFGTLAGVGEAAQFFLQSLTNPSSPLELMLRYFALFPGERALGFDRPSPGGSTGEALSAGAVGHLGFTGCSLWVDPLHQGLYVLLLRRLDQGERQEELKNFRREFHRRAAIFFR